MATGGATSRASAEADELIRNMELFRSVNTPPDFAPDGARLRDPVTSRNRRHARQDHCTSTPQTFNFERQFAETSQRLINTQLELGRMQSEFTEQQHELAELKNRFTTDKLMPMKYSGTSDFDEYLTQFEAIAGLQNWNDERKAVVLLSKLEGQALSIASTENQRTFSSLVACLRENFSPQQQTIFALKLNSRVQGKNETFEALANDIKRLTKKAYMTADDLTKDRLATDAFVNAISDDSVREKLRDKAPVTISQALREVRQIAVNREIEKQRAKQTVRSVEMKPSSKENDEVMKLQEKLSKLEAELKKFHGERLQVKKPRVCYHCSLPGHVKKFCPFDPCNQMLPSVKAQTAGNLVPQRQGNFTGQTS